MGQHSVSLCVKDMDAMALAHENSCIGTVFEYLLVCRLCLLLLFPCLSYWFVSCICDDHLIGDGMLGMAGMWERSV